MLASRGSSWAVVDGRCGYMGRRLGTTTVGASNSGACCWTGQLSVPRPFTIEPRGWSRVAAEGETASTSGERVRTPSPGDSAPSNGANRPSVDAVADWGGRRAVQRRPDPVPHSCGWGRNPSSGFGLSPLLIGSPRFTASTSAARPMSMMRPREHRTARRCMRRAVRREGGPAAQPRSETRTATPSGPTTRMAATSSRRIAAFIRQSTGRSSTPRKEPASTARPSRATNSTR